MRSGWNRTTGRLRAGRIAIVLQIGLLAAGWFAPTAVDAGASRIRPLSEVEARAIDRAGRLVNTGHRADGFRILDSLLASASARGDTALRYRVSAAAAGLHAWLDEAPQADSILRPILGRIEACGDTAFFLGAAMWYAKALLDQTHFAEAESVYRRLLPVAVHAGNTESEGWTRMGLAYIALSSGRDDEARDGYESAERLLRKSGNRFGELEALIGLARAYRQIGETDSSRACCVEACTRARRYGLPRNEAIALNNLGVEEFARGDPAAGLRDFRAAWRIGKSVGDRRETKMPAANAARALAALGRYDEAASVLDSLSVSCHAEGFLDYEAVTLLELGRLWNEAGRPLRALRTYRRVMDLGDELPIGSRLAAYGGSADALARIEGPVKALEILESGSCRRLRPVVPADVRVEYDTKRAQLLAEVGRDGEALALAEAAEVEADRLHRTELQIALLTTAARVRLTQGDRRTALRYLARATEAWERLRKRPSDPEWRELWTDGLRLTSTLIQMLLADPTQPSDRARLQAAFEAAQRFKARGLAERIEGKIAPSAVIPSISLDRVQRDLLRPGELLLDAFVGPDSSFIFAVTQDRCGLIRLPGEDALAGKIEALRELILVSPPVDVAEHQATLQEVAERLSDFLLGGVRDLVAGSDRILLAPDGPLHLLPLEMLRFDGKDPGDGRWLGTTRVCARIPSIAHLARLRENAMDAAGPDPGIVLCGGVNSAGQALAGAAAEARALRRRFGNFRVLRSEIDSAAAASTNWLTGYRMVHFAAHTELNESYPWRSGILLHSGDAPGGTRLLCAEKIAAAPLDARLVFISGCESARGRVIRGEGIQGLSTAFLAAGTQSVVATLWPVEDRATSRFVSFFYDGVGRGLCAGEALRLARIRMARSERYGDPSHWAGFVLIGEPDTRVHLRSRWPYPVAYYVAALLLVSIAVLGFTFRFRGRPSRRKGA
jgi:tetratricopeptide (TPR) repeat protein